VSATGLISFVVTVKESDLWVSAEKHLENETRDLVFNLRNQIETYIEQHPEFLTTLDPIPSDPYAPPVVKDMINASMKVNVGPMAAVAGAIAEHVGLGLYSFSDQIIVENGGDIFLKTRRPVTVSIAAGDSPLNEKVGLLIPVEQMPLGICSSSGTVGHSLSLGNSDVCCLVSPSVALADAAATALGNRVREKRDLKKVAGWSKQVEGLVGGIVIMGDQLAAWGDIELVDL
jgi:ApbE superfamily uncharacterized protein (UPF0280 family)